MAHTQEVQKFVMPLARAPWLQTAVAKVTYNRNPRVARQSDGPCCLKRHRILWIYSRTVLLCYLLYAHADPLSKESSRMHNRLSVTS
jgi:hypothetical protein